MSFAIIPKRVIERSNQFFYKFDVSFLTNKPTGSGWDVATFAESFCNVHLRNCFSRPVYDLNDPYLWVKVNDFFMQELCYYVKDLGESLGLVRKQVENLQIDYDKMKKAWDQEVTTNLALQRELSKTQEELRELKEFIASLGD